MWRGSILEEKQNCIMKSKDKTKVFHTRGGYSNELQRILQYIGSNVT